MNEEVDFNSHAFQHFDSSNISINAFENDDEDDEDDVYHFMNIDDNAMNVDKNDAGGDNDANNKNNNLYESNEDVKATHMAENTFNAATMTNQQLFHHAALLTGKIGPMKVQQNKIILLDYLIQRATQDPSSFPLTMERGHATTQWDVLADDLTARFIVNQSAVSNTAPATSTGIKLRLCVNAIGSCLRHVKLDEFHGMEQFWLIEKESVEFKLWTMSEICKATKKPIGHVDKKVAKEPIAIEPKTGYTAQLHVEATKESHGKMLGTLLSYLQSNGSISLEEMNTGMTRLSSDVTLIDALLALNELQQIAFIVDLNK